MTTRDPLISVAICTYNRANFLKDALRSIRNQELDHTKIEIIVVDNGSQDHTVRVVEEHQSMSDIETRLHVSPEKSLSVARNIALTHFRGEFICFLDDDAQADREWLNRIVDVFSSDVDGFIGAVGGRVEPIWEVEPGIFDCEMFRGMYSLCDYAPTRCSMLPPHVPTGVNFAVRRHAIECVGYFDTNLGRKGDSLLSGEETMFLEAIRSGGFSLFYEPSMLVYHFVSKERLTAKWVIQRATWGGRTHAVMQHINGFGLARRCTTLVTSTINLLRYLMLSYGAPGTEQQRLQWKANLHIRLGYLSQIFNVSSSFK